MATEAEFQATISTLSLGAHLGSRAAQAQLGAAGLTLKQPLRTPEASNGRSCLERYSRRSDFEVP